MAPAEEATPAPTADARSAPQPSTVSPTPENGPPEKDWKSEYARLRKDYDAKASRLNELEKTVKAPESAKTDTSSELDWKLENIGRIKLVKDDYKNELADFEASGVKLTPVIMEKALRLAEEKSGVRSSSEANRQFAMSSPPATVNRDASSEDDVTLTETDKRLGVSLETKRKHRELVEG
ncbi:MAG: hypothetical protein [Siphoviridae sp. ctpQM7]|nr:MAG: hypothetical protein [Siphoviridae sp. ctpQM7]